MSVNFSISSWLKRLWKGKELLSFSGLSLASVTGQMKAVLVIQILVTVKDTNE